MISFPDALLARLDARAQRLGTSRSGLLQELAERELRVDGESRRRLVEELLVDASDHGGEGVRYVREQRRNR